jgi:CheY-like chemotaxis protein
LEEDSDDCEDLHMMNLRFLLVDDEPFNLIALEGLLNLSGFTSIRKCFNGVQALEVLNEEPYNFDIIMTD